MSTAPRRSGCRRVLLWTLGVAVVLLAASCGRGGQEGFATPEAAFDALAAAYARAQRFDEAVSSVSSALTIGERTLSPGDLEDIQKRRALYQNRQPYTQDIL